MPPLPITRSMSYRPSRPSISGWFGVPSSLSTSVVHDSAARRSTSDNEIPICDVSGSQRGSLSPLRYDWASFHTFASAASVVSRDWHAAHVSKCAAAERYALARLVVSSAADSHSSGTE